MAALLFIWGQKVSNNFADGVKCAYQRPVLCEGAHEVPVAAAEKVEFLNQAKFCLNTADVLKPDDVLGAV